jgi:hypothetical protein
LNKDRRQQIVEAGKLVTDITLAIAVARDHISGIRDDEQEYLDGLHENFKNGERGQTAEAAVASLDSALEAIDSLDTESIIRPLEEASEMSVEAETKAAKISKQQAEKNRRDRLPRWAKDEIDRLQNSIETLRVKAQEPFKEQTGEKDEIVNADWTGPLVGRVLPAKRIEFPAFGIQVAYEEGYPGITIRTNRGGLRLLPRASNEIIAVPYRFGMEDGS